MNASIILRHISSSTQKSVCRYFKTVSPLNNQSMAVRGTTPPHVDMLRLWGQLQQDSPSTSKTSHYVDTFSTLVTDHTIKGTKVSEIFGKRKARGEKRLNRKPVFGDFMVVQEPSMLNPTPSVIPVTMRKDLMRCLKGKRSKRNEENLKQFLLSV